MASGVSGVCAHRAPVARFTGPPRSGGALDKTLSRNILIAGVSCASLALIAAGALMSSGMSGTPYVASGKALKVALIDPAAPQVVARDPRVALRTPGPHLSANYTPPHHEFVPLPHARPEP